jgi:hypothetical protein
MAVCARLSVDGVDQLRGGPCHVNALEKPLARLPHKYCFTSKMLWLQAQLLRRLATATSQSDWLAKAPVGLDLEHCMNTPKLRDVLLQSDSDMLPLILQDRRTRVASENTCLALVACSSAQRRLPRLLRCVRWRWLSKSYIPVAQKLLTADDYEALQAVQTADKDVQVQLLQGIPYSKSVLKQTAHLHQRPASSVCQLKLRLFSDIESLRSTFGAVDIIPVHDWSRHGIFGGFFWKGQLQWVQDKGDPTLWGLGMAVVVKGPSSGGPLTSRCMLGGVFHVEVDSKLVHRARNIWWHDSSCAFVLCDDLLGQKFRSWSEAQKRLSGTKYTWYSLIVEQVGCEVAVKLAFVRSGLCRIADLLPLVLTIYDAWNLAGSQVHRLHNFE